MVYVDPLFVMKSKNRQAAFVGERTGHRWCHMFADSLEELHAMADKLGLKRSWFQNHPRHPRYDLVPSKRDQALRLGAVSVDRRQAIEILRRVRSNS